MSVNIAIPNKTNESTFELKPEIVSITSPDLESSVSVSQEVASSIEEEDLPAAEWT